MTIFYIWTLKLPKNRHFMDRFLKLPLIVIVAP